MARDSSRIEQLVAGTNVTIDEADPSRPVINSTGGGGISDGDKGDITVSASGATWTIDDEAVTLAKMDHVATNRILGRATAGTGDVEALTAVQAADTIGVGTGDSPQFTGVNVGHATDTTITRVSAGEVAVEGKPVPTVSSGAGAPATTPSKEGDIYVDTTADTYYVAVGTASSADWEENGTGGTGDLWSDAVDADIVPDADNTRDLGSPSNNFAQIHGLTYYGVDEVTFRESASAGILLFCTHVGTANYLQIANAAASGTPEISAVGSDTNVSINLLPKGSGEAQVSGEKILDESDKTGVDAGVVSGTAGTSGNLVEWNADGDAVDSGVATSSLVTAQTKAISIESPTATEDISLFFTDDAITVTQMNAVCRGTTPSVTWTIRHGTDRSAAGAEVVTSGTTTTSTTTGSEVTSFNDATIPAGSWVWLETTAQTGTVDELSISVEYTVD